MQEDSGTAEKWRSLRVWSPAVVHEALANFLMEQTGRGVQLRGEWIIAYCRRGAEVQSCLRTLGRYYQALKQLHGDLPELKVTQQDLVAEDWSEAWKQYFKPILIGKNLVVKPSWEAFEAGPDQVVIEIDPGRAFGTGQHPSTALSMELLEQVLSAVVSPRVTAAPSVLDLGTGSGILGIVAARLGARRVLGLDIDPEALEIAAGNVDLNGVGDIMTVSATPLEKVEETFDLVVANLTATLITQMATDLAASVRPGGRLLLSGILTDQVEEVGSCFRAHNFAVIEQRAREEWRALLLGKTRRGVCSSKSRGEETSGQG